MRDEATPQYAGANPSVPNHVLCRVVVDAEGTHMDIVEEPCDDCPEPTTPQRPQAPTASILPPAWALFVMGFLATAGVLIVLRSRTVS